jgi:hypothetical protein
VASGLAGTSGGWSGRLWWGLGLVALSVLVWGRRADAPGGAGATYLVSIPVLFVVLF